jgi:tRNA(Ile)-lysidine synthase
LRGAESDRDAEFCARLAQDCGVGLDVELCDVAGLAARHRRSLEEAARELRYAFLERVRQRRQADVVAVGQTCDDQAETVLLRLVRGAGSRGLTAIHPRRQQIVRPLIDLRRADLVSYLEAHGRTWRVDGSNHDRARRRNRLRHDVLPALVASEGDSVVNVLARTAEVAAADEALLAALARDARARVVAVEDGAVLRLKVAALTEEPLALRRRVVQWALARVSDRAPTFAHVDATLRFLERGRPGVLTMHGGHVELSDGQGVLSSRPRRQAGPESFGSWQYRLCVPGELVVPEAGIRLQALVSPVEMAAAAVTQGAIVDLPAPADGLVVRAWQAGDRMRLSGGSGRKKVQDLFVDRKVPRADRHRVPIVTAADGRIIWVLGHALAGGFGVTDATKSVVVLSFEPLGGN